MYAVYLWHLEESFFYFVYPNFGENSFKRPVILCGFSSIVNCFYLIVMMTMTWLLFTWPPNKMKIIRMVKKENPSFYQFMKDLSSTS